MGIQDDLSQHSELNSGLCQIPGGSECYTLLGKRAFTDAIEVRIWSETILSHAVGSKSNDECSCKKKAGGALRNTEEEMLAQGQQLEWCGCEAQVKECLWLPDTRRSKGQTLPRACRRTAVPTA